MTAADLAARDWAFQVQIFGSHCEPKLSTVEDSYQFGAVISLEQHIKVVETIKSGEYIVS